MKRKYNRSTAEAGNVEDPQLSLSVFLSTPPSTASSSSLDFNTAHLSYDNNNNEFSVKSHSKNTAYPDNNVFSAYAHQFSAPTSTASRELSLFSPFVVCVNNNKQHYMYICTYITLIGHLSFMPHFLI